MARISARVTWEDSDRPAKEIYYETSSDFADGLTCDANAFLVGCVLPAMYFGEKRIQIEGAVCPILKEGLYTNMNYFQHWRGEKYKPIDVECRTIKTYSPSAKGVKRTASFLSGGIDSLFTLRMNRLNVPVGHPGSIQDCFFVHGFDIYHDENEPKKLDLFQRGINGLKEVAEDAKIHLIPVQTNVRHLYSDVSFWMTWFFGAALASVAHAFSNRIGTIHIAASFDLPRQIPWGSHPITDRNYGSYDLCVLHDGIRFSRLGKTKIVSGWDAALQNIRVCVANPEDGLNCGKCEKCLRVMTTLVAVGKLRETNTFPVRDLTAKMLERLVIQYEYSLWNYRELLGELTAQGRYDLVDVIRKKILECEKRLAWKSEIGLKGKFKRFDRIYFKSTVSRMMNHVMDGRLIPLRRGGGRLKLYYYKDPKISNFGDDLNTWLWPKLIPELLDDDTRTLFIGIGTLLNDSIPDVPKKVVFSSGVGYGNFVPKVDLTWKICCLRGPLSATALGVSPKLALTDGAVLLRRFHSASVRKLYRFSFMPHAVHANSGWEMICEKYGFGYIDARWPIERILPAITSTECLLTESLHGAVAADTFRIPWIPVHSSKIILPFKWKDWCLSVRVKYEPRYISRLLMPVWSYRKPRGFYPALRHAVKTQLIGTELKRIAHNTVPNLSEEKVIEYLTQELEARLEELKCEFRMKRLSNTAV